MKVANVFFIIGVFAWFLLNLSMFGHAEPASTISMNDVVGTTVLGAVLMAVGYWCGKFSELED